ncbi:MAG: mechanosensitive ion channel family protein [Henriciella sp.]
MGRWIGLVLLAVMLAVSAFAQDAAGAADRFNRLQTEVEAAKSDLAAASDTSDVSAARLILQEGRVELQDLQRSFRASKSQLEVDLGVLGPAPENGQEPDAVADLRRTYADRIAEYDRLNVLASALMQQIDTTLENSAQQLRDAFLSSLLYRAPPPYLPAELSAASSQLAEKLANGQAWLSGGTQNEAGAPQSSWTLLWVLVGSIVIIFLINVPIKDRVAAQLWRQLPRREITPAGPSAIALTRTSTRIVLAAISVFAAHRLSLEIGLVADTYRSTLDQIARAVFLLLCANAISRGLFAPDNEHWRTFKMSNATAKGAHFAALSVATLFAIDQVLVALIGRGDFGALLRLETLVAAIVFGIVMITLYRRLQRIRESIEDSASLETTGPASPKGGTRKAVAQLLLLLPALVMVAASLLGYAALSRWVFEKAAYFALFLGYAYLLRKFLGSWTLLAVERITFGKTRNEVPADDIIGFWTRFSVDILIAIGAFPIILAIFGMEWTEIRTLALNFMSGFSIGSISVSPSNLIYGLLLVIAILMITRLAQRVLENRILPKTRLNPGIRNSLKTLVGYAGLLFAFFTGVSALGFNLSNLAIIAGALSVGIGFGLQSIVNNFVSGLILLFERPIKIDDWVITASGEGRVKKINVRSTEIETFDRCSIIVPNSELISSSVQNWTYKDDTARVIVPVGVSYDSDPEQVREVLLTCAQNHPQILEDPEPFVYFADFADSSLNLELRAFIRDANNSLLVRNDLRFKIFSALKKAGIEIPFPQRDIHIRSTVKGAPETGLE